MWALESHILGHLAPRCCYCLGGSVSTRGKPLTGLLSPSNSGRAICVPVSHTTWSTTTSLSRWTVPSEMSPKIKYSSLPVNCFCPPSCPGDTESQSHGLPDLLQHGKCHASLPVAQKRHTTAVVSRANTVSNTEVRQTRSTVQDSQRQRDVVLSWKADSLKGTLIHKRVGWGSKLNSPSWFSASLSYSCQLWSLERESEWSGEGERFKTQQRQSDSLTPREGWNSWMIALLLPGEASREGQPSGDSIQLGREHRLKSGGERQVLIWVSRGHMRARLRLRLWEAPISCPSAKRLELAVWFCLCRQGSVYELQSTLCFHVHGQDRFPCVWDPAG